MSVILLMVDFFLIGSLFEMILSGSFCNQCIFFLFYSFSTCACLISTKNKKEYRMKKKNFNLCYRTGLSYAFVFNMFRLVVCQQNIRQQGRYIGMFCLQIKQFEGNIYILAQLVVCHPVFVNYFLWNHWICFKNKMLLH